MKTALILAAASLLLLNTAARAREGILVCQMGVSAFAEDAARMKGRLSANQMAAVRQLVDISRGQCRSNTDVVNAKISSMRAALGVGSGPRSVEHFDEFWPAGREELSELTK